MGSKWLAEIRDGVAQTTIILKLYFTFSPCLRSGISRGSSLHWFDFLWGYLCVRVFFTDTSFLYYLSTFNCLSPLIDLFYSTNMKPRPFEPKCQVVQLDCRLSIVLRNRQLKQQLATFTAHSCLTWENAAECASTSPGTWPVGRAHRYLN